MKAFAAKTDKRHVEATVNFAVNHIPQADKITLEQYLELVNATGNFGTVSNQQLLCKMQLLVKYVPNVCRDSLMMLADLLDLWPLQERDQNIVIEEIH